jgi:hypothetical protein
VIFLLSIYQNKKYKKKDNNQIINYLYLVHYKKNKDLEEQVEEPHQRWRKKKNLYHHHLNVEHLRKDRFLLRNLGDTMIEVIYQLESIINHQHQN